MKPEPLLTLHREKQNRKWSTQEPWSFLYMGNCTGAGCAEVAARCTCKQLPEQLQLPLRARSFLSAGLQLNKGGRIIIIKKSSFLKSKSIIFLFKWSLLYLWIWATYPLLAQGQLFIWLLIPTLPCAQWEVVLLSGKTPLHWQGPPPALCSVTRERHRGVGFVTFHSMSLSLTVELHKRSFLKRQFTKQSSQWSETGVQFPEVPLLISE